MRHRFAIALAPFALLACSSAAEPQQVGTTTEGITKGSNPATFCPIGSVYKCEYIAGREVCGCVDVPQPPPPPPVCNFVAPAGPPGGDTWVEAWAVFAPTGQCPDVAGSWGTWKNLSSEYAGMSALPNCFDGVPNEYLELLSKVHQCSEILPAGECCTYVWWPTEFVQPTTCPTASLSSQGAAQDAEALCAGNTSTWYALESTACVGSSCGEPVGGGGCGTCRGI